MRLSSTTIILLACLLPQVLSAQRLVLAEWYFFYKLNPKTNRICLTTILPQSIPGRQEIKELWFSKPYTDQYEEQGTQYVVFDIEKPSRREKIVVRAVIALYRSDLNTLQRKVNKKILEPLSIPRDSMLRFLEPEPMLEVSHPEIMAAAMSLKHENTVQCIKNIFEFVTKTIDYKVFKEQQRGALTALREGMGDCTEYAELMVALCRANGIPAKVVLGALSDLGSNAIHNWVEAWIPELGWVSFDPTIADCEQCGYSFDKMSNNYLILSYQRFHEKVGSTMETSADGRFLLKNKQAFALTLADLISEPLQRAKDEMKKKHYSSALAICDTIMKTGVSNPNLYVLRGMIQARSGQMDKGVREFQRAIRRAYLKVEKCYVYYSFSKLLAMRNDKALAFSYFKEAVQLGFNAWFDAHTDPSFGPLRDLPEFRNLLKEHPPAIDVWVQEDIYFNWIF